MEEKKIYNVKDLGAVGDGITDDTEACQKALDLASGSGEAVFPEGNYLVKKLKVSSDTVINAFGARIIFSGELPKKRGDFLLQNKDPINGNENIVVRGGIWDGNYDGKNNKKAELFDMDGFCGATMNFVNVRNLVLEDFTIANSTCFYVRMSKIDGFRFSRLVFTANNMTSNQDGLHFGGYCRNGVVTDIRGENMQTNDDMIALNADDCVTRVDNLDLFRGPIENVVFKNIHADNCYTFARMCSVTAPIRNIVMENIYAGCRMYFLNMDGARYCATPIFKEDEFPGGTGAIENVVIRNAKFFKTSDNGCPLFTLETLCRDLKIENAEILDSDNKTAPTIHARNLTGTKITYTADGEKTAYFAKKSDELIYSGKLTSLEVSSDHLTV